MGKKIMKCCALAATGAMVFQFGGCLGGLWKVWGQAAIGGSGFETGRDLTSTFLLDGITVTQDAINTVNFEEAVAAERAARAGG